MKQLILLYDDGHTSTIPEKNISRTNLDFVSYVLVPISVINRVYVCVRPSKYMLFTKAYIQYTLCVIYVDEANYEFYETDVMDTVTVETDSICDVYGLLNSIDRLNVANHLITGSGCYDYNDYLWIGLASFQLILEDDDKVIYSGSYERRGISSMPYDSYQVTKHFKKIYNSASAIVSDMYKSDQMFYLSSNYHITEWKRSKKEENQRFQLVGVPCIGTDTITFLTRDEFHVVENLHRVSVDSMVFYARSDRYEEMTSLISQGELHHIDSLEELMEECFVSVRVHVCGSKTHEGWLYEIIEILAHTPFACDLIAMVFSHVYEGSEPNHPCTEFVYDVALECRMTFLDENPADCVFLMNRDSVMTLSDIFIMLQTRMEEFK